MTTLTRHFIRKRLELLLAGLEQKAAPAADRPKPIEQSRIAEAESRLSELKALNEENPIGGEK